MKGINPLFGTTARMKMQVDSGTAKADEYVKAKWNEMTGGFTYYAKLGLIIAGVGVLVNLMKK